MLSIGCVTLFPAVLMTIISPRLKPSASSSIPTKRVSIQVTMPNFFVGWLVSPAFGSSGCCFTYSLLVSIIFVISIIRVLTLYTLFPPEIDSIHYIHLIHHKTSLNFNL